MLGPLSVQGLPSALAVRLLATAGLKPASASPADLSRAAPLSAECPDTLLHSKSISPAFEGASFANAKDGGVEVTDVAKGSVAQRFGLRKGDVITAVNRAEIKTISDLKKNLENVKGKISAIRINRNGGTLFITIR